MKIMDGAQYFEEISNFVRCYKLKIEDEKKEIAECEKEFSNLVAKFSEKPSSDSVINSLFKNDEPEGFVFSKYEEKRKQLAEQRRAEYNAYLEKKEAELFSKKRVNEEKKNVSPKSILDSVDYERVLAKRKEEEARFRNMNIANSQPIVNGETKLPDSSAPSSSHVSPRNRINSMPVSTVNLSKTPSVPHDVNIKYPEPEEKMGIESLNEKSFKLLEQRIVKQLEEKKHQMLLEFENELRKENIDEIQSMKSSSSVKNSPQRIIQKSEEFPIFGRTGGGGEPVRDSYGNLLAMRGQRRKSSSEYDNIMSFPSMQQQSAKDRMTIYREELQKQIEEKKRLEALERAKAREQEEKIAQRAEEQRLKMQEEYENEQKKNKKKESQQRQQQRIRQLEEFQKKDEEARRRRLVEVKAPSPAPEKQPVVQERSNSPPIPAVRTKFLLEKVVEAAPKVVKPENPFSSLAEIRRKIREEQQKPKNNLTNSYEVMNRRTVQDIADDDDDDDDILRTSTNSYKYSA